jgi:transcriptional regulator with XRE-family HTH domain/tetratricopeptide (TPR) repeat protein
VDANASSAARLGAEIRARRERHGLTLETLARLIQFSPGHISSVERAQAPVSEQFVAGCDEALNAGGALLELLPSVICERAADRHRNQALRRKSGARPTETRDTIAGEPQDGGPSPASLVVHTGAVTGKAASFGGSRAGTPLSSPTLSKPDVSFATRWQRLLEVFIASERVLGSRPVITAMAAELPMLRAQREAARPEARIELLRAESRWAEFVSWLSDNVGAHRSGRLWINRAGDLARESGDHPMVAYVLMRKSQQALEHGHDVRGAVNMAEAAQREHELPPLVRALSAVREAQGHAVLGNRAGCARKLDEAHELIERATGAHDPWWNNTGTHCTHGYVRAYEGQCWLQLQEPQQAIHSFEQALASWQGIYRAEEALQRARLAIAHAANDDPDLAAREGQRTLEIHRAAPSSRALVELGRLDQRLARWPMVADIQSFRDGFAAARRHFDASLAN